MAPFHRICVSLFFLLSAIPVMAGNTNMCMDILGGVADTGDARGQIATGTVLGIDIGPSLHAVTRIQYSFRPAKVALITLYGNITEGIDARYVTVKDKPDSILTFKDRKTAPGWYKKTGSDIQVFIVPVNCIDKSLYDFTPCNGPW